MRGTSLAPPVLLEPFAPADAARLASWVCSPEELFAWAGARFAPPLTEDDLRSHAVRTADPTCGIRAFRVVDPMSGEAVGHLELTGLLPEQTSSTLRRVVVAPDRRRRGLGTEMVRAAVGVAFGDLGLHRVEVRVFDDNDAALSLYRRCGFTIEGRLREYRRLGGRFRSAYVLGVLSSEWPAA
jgi:RimJ/RimL family protein N-acetyltransferase